MKTFSFKGAYEASDLQGLITILMPNYNWVSGLFDRGLDDGQVIYTGSVHALYKAVLSNKKRPAAINLLGTPQRPEDKVALLTLVGMSEPQGFWDIHGLSIYSKESLPIPTESDLAHVEEFYPELHQTYVRLLA